MLLVVKRGTLKFENRLGWLVGSEREGGKGEGRDYSPKEIFGRIWSIWVERDIMTGFSLGKTSSSTMYLSKVSLILVPRVNSS